MARSKNLESGFQDRLIETLNEMFPGCMIFKMNYPQGIPDLLILYGRRWAALECKRKPDSAKQPNQFYYITKMAKMSFAKFINNENREEVLCELQKILRPAINITENRKDIFYELQKALRPTWETCTA